MKHDDPFGDFLAQMDGGTHMPPEELLAQIERVAAEAMAAFLEYVPAKTDYDLLVLRLGMLIAGVGHSIGVVWEPILDQQEFLTMLVIYAYALGRAGYCAEEPHDE